MNRLRLCPAAGNNCVPFSIDLTYIDLTPELVAPFSKFAQVDVDINSLYNQRLFKIQSENNG